VRKPVGAGADHGGCVRAAMPAIAASVRHVALVLCFARVPYPTDGQAQKGVGVGVVAGHTVGCPCSVSSRCARSRSAQGARAHVKEGRE
jgi:hypothetical protein